MASSGNGPGWFVMVRDPTLFVGGFLGIGYQTISRDVNPVLTAVFLSMLGLPGVAGVISLARNSGQPSPSSPPSSPSSSPSSLSAEE